MPVAAAYRSEVTVVETLGDAYLASDKNAITHNGLNKTANLNAGSSVPVTKVASFAQALTDGAATIDLTALAGTNGGTTSFSGLKVQLAKFRAKSTNANSLTIEVGASNGYALAGSGFGLTLQPGQEVTLFLNEQAPDVGGSAKTLDLAGTGAQVLEVELVAG